MPLRTKRRGSAKAQGPDQSGLHRGLFHRLLERNAIRRLSYQEYREKVRQVYGGPRGAALSLASTLSLHLPLGERLFRCRKFDLRGARRILDVGSGAGQMAGHLLKYADPQAEIVCFDLSHQMLHRARHRLRSPRPRFLVADLTQLPFADGTFDCVTCGYVLEHVPDPLAGLAELARVMQPGGRLLLLATEDTFTGAWTSLLWCCQTYNRRQLTAACSAVGLQWKQDLWFTQVHKLLRMGGICAELVKR